MRINVNGHEVEGTAAEIAQLLKLVDGPSRRQSAAPSRAAGASPFVTEDVAHDVLTRRELGDSHAQLLRCLYAADNEWVPAPDLQASLNLSTREFAGVLGSLGKRISNTEGVGSRSFLDQYWDADGGYNLYRMPPSVRAAAERAKVVP